MRLSKSHQIKAVVTRPGEDSVIGGDDDSEGNGAGGNNTVN